MTLLRTIPLVLLVLGAGACDDDSGTVDAAIDAGACVPDGGTHCLVVDDAGVSHGCMTGGMGPGDRDDGGGMSNVGPPDASADAMNLSLGEVCLFNRQCTSNICFLYRVKGQFCTQFCSCDSDCPAPSLGCGGQGVCRIGN